MATLNLPQVPGTEPSRAVLDAFRIAIAFQVHRALPQLTVEQVYPGVLYGVKGIDFTVALARFRLGGKPDEWAKKVTDSFQADEYVESATQLNGFVNFKLNTKSLMSKVLRQVDALTNHTEDKTPQYGSNSSGAGKNIIIEYSSPNIAKQFHVGNLRSTIIGGFLTNVYKANGWDVIGMNYLGDWGKQFGMIAVGFEKYGSEEALARDAIKHLYDVYVKINADASNDESVHDAARAYFKRMEDGDESALQNWRKWRDLSIEKYKEEYARLNIAFDIYSGESQVGADTLKTALDKLKEMGLVSESKGAQVIDLEKFKLGKAVIQKQDGTSLYLTRDIAAAIERYEKYKFDRMIYVIASQQDLHCSQFFKTLELMEYPWAKSLEHVNFGMVLGMSTRKGTAVFLDDVIREAASIMKEKMMSNEEKYNAIEDPEAVSREIGLSAIKIQDMAAKRINNYSFNWSRMTSFEGDTGPYLQYAHVRLSSISRKNPELLPLPAADKVQTDLLTEPQAREMVFLLASYPDVVRVACEKNEPSGVVTFAMKLSHAISSAWDPLPVKGLAADQIEVARARLWLFLCARDVLGAAMRLLSIRPLERM
ncbi:arginyl-tRNA synthetase [Rhizoctonia solani AG-1 IB]|uniref:arginine--tRNA ligase n=1 Tax=Thanatephorus cucumeris (strain AG1-IB / isolate 7/3/14) TaxID=1108050 RepID=A0A0B7FHE5_THACB|nr:arginyl-tRNA synthetase [Rhizoctonia solani AG-1 IB]